MLAGFVNAAECADGERGVKRGGKAFAGNVADIQADGAVTEGEIVEIISTHFGGGLKFVRDGDLLGAQGMRGEHHVLDGASLFEILLAEFFDGTQFKRKQ